MSDFAEYLNYNLYLRSYSLVICCAVFEDGRTMQKLGVKEIGNMCNLLCVFMNKPFQTINMFYLQGKGFVIVC